MYKERLKFIREEAEIKQETIATYLNMHRGSYSKYEIEDAIMPTKHINTLCNYFNVSFDYIFNLSDEKCYQNSNTNINQQKTKQRLKEFRKDNKMSQDKLAQILGTAKTTISGYERGARIIATPFLYDICKRYNVSADYLLGKIDYIPTLK